MSRVISPLYREAVPRLQTRGTKAVKPRGNKPLKQPWFRNKNHHELLLCIPPNGVEHLVMTDGVQSLVEELFWLNKTNQGEFVLGKVTKTTVDIYRVR